MYKASRRREYDRLRAMDEEVQKEKDMAGWEKERREREERDREKTRRNRERREKLKNRKGKKGGKMEDGDGGELEGAGKGRGKIQVRVELGRSSGEGQKVNEEMGEVAQEAEVQGVIIHDDD